MLHGQKGEDWGGALALGLAATALAFYGTVEQHAYTYTYTYIPFTLGYLDLHITPKRKERPREGEESAACTNQRIDRFNSQNLEKKYIRGGNNAPGGDLLVLTLLLYLSIHQIGYRRYPGLAGTWLGPSRLSRSLGTYPTTLSDGGGGLGGGVTLTLPHLTQTHAYLRRDGSFVRCLVHTSLPGRQLMAHYESTSHHGTLDITVYTQNAKQLQSHC